MTVENFAYKHQFSELLHCPYSHKLGILWQRTWCKFNFDLKTISTIFGFLDYDSFWFKPVEGYVCPVLQYTLLYSHKIHHSPTYSIFPGTKEI